MSNWERYIEFRYGAWWIAERRPGTEVNLADLAPNQSVTWGDGETYHLLLTRTDATTEAEALYLALRESTPAAPQGAEGE